jgi:hypothetical protein
METHAVEFAPQRILQYKTVAVSCCDEISVAANSLRTKWRKRVGSNPREN